MSYCHVSVEPATSTVAVVSMLVSLVQW